MGRAFFVTRTGLARFAETPASEQKRPSNMTCFVIEALVWVQDCWIHGLDFVLH